MSDPRAPWQTPGLHTLDVGMDTAFEGGSGGDLGSVSNTPPSPSPAPGPV